MRTRDEEGERFQPGSRSNGRPQTGSHVACGDAGQGLTECSAFHHKISERINVLREKFWFGL